MDTRTAFGGSKQRQPTMLPRIVALEHPVSPEAAPVRRLPVGAEPQPDGGVHFRVWAPRCDKIAVEIEGLEPVALEPESGDYFSLLSLTARAGMRYHFRLDRGETALPDPASRFQPDGPHGPSQIVDPATFAWTDGAWRGIAREHLVIYEMHVGTFTPEGSWEAASHELSALAELGVTCVEIRASHLSLARRQQARPPARKTVDQLSARRRGAVPALYANHPGRAIRDQRGVRSADVAVGCRGRRGPDLYRRRRLAP